MKHGMVRRAIVESQGRRKVAADEAKVITDQLSKLKKLYEYKNGLQIRQLLIEPKNQRAYSRLLV